MRTRILLVSALLFAVGCERSESSTTQPAQESQPKPAEPSPQPEPEPEPADVRDEAIETMVAEAITYTEQMMTMFPLYDGDCDAFAQKALVLEPLAQSVRKKMEDLAKAGAGAQKLASELNQRIKAQKDQALPRIEAKLAAMGKTMQDFESAAQRIETECASNPRWADTKSRVGLFKKKE